MKKKKSLQVVNSIKVLILKKNLIQPNQSILLAISGGQDSIFLLILFYLLKNQWNLKLKIFCCNHLWQQNSLYVYLHISKISFCLNIQVFYSITLKKLNSEEQGRYWRSKNYYRLIQFSNSAIVLTGHTLTDQIETFFFNTIRGSSFNGSFSLKLKREFVNKNKRNFYLSQSELKYFFTLKNSILFPEIERKIYLSKKNLSLKKKLYKKAKIKNLFFDKKNFNIFKRKPKSLQVIRPLITKTRFDTKNICEGWKLPLFVDQTNEETKYSRNRLRKQILPMLRYFFNPKVDLSLYRYNDILLEEDYYGYTLIRKLIKLLVSEDQTGYFVNIALFSSLPLSLQRKICFLFFKENLRVKYTFFTINTFISFTNQFLKLTKKQKKSNPQRKKVLWVFFPEIGIIGFSKNLLIFFK